MHLPRLSTKRLGILLLPWFASSLVLSAELPEPRFRAVNVDTNLAIGYGVTVADIDGDRRPDLILCDKNQIAWYHNPDWAKHVIAQNLTKLDHVCVAAQDIDGDGQAELAVGAGWNPGDTENSGAVFYLTPPADRTQPWRPVALPHEPTVHRMRWLRDAAGKWSLLVVPLHGRGNKDGVGAGVKILQYLPPAKPGGDWTTRLLDDTLHKTHNFELIARESGLGQDVLVGGKEGWFLTKPTATKPADESEHLGGDEGGGVGEIRLGHSAGGRRWVATVEPMHGNALVVYTPPRGTAGPGTRWNRYVLDESLVDAHALACGDLLGLGRDQIVVGWRAMNRPGVKVGIRIFTPLDNQALEWRSSWLDEGGMACEDLCLADLNGDGRLDVIAAGRATHNLKVYLNERR